MSGLPRPWWHSVGRHAGGLALLYLPLVWYFFCVGAFSSLAWNHTADADAPYAAQTILLLSDGDGQFFAHPGATIFAVVGGVQRLLAPFFETQRAVAHLAQAATSPQAEQLLTTTVVTGRMVALFLLLALATTLYALIFRLTCRQLLAWLFAFFIVTSRGVLYHIAVLRPESPNILFFFTAILLGVAVFDRPRTSLARMLLGVGGAGLSLGLTLFSKVQLLPFIALMAAGIVLIPWRPGGPARWAVLDRRGPLINLGLALVAAALLPYWGLVRPAFLTPELFAAMYRDTQLGYGALPASLVPAAAAVMAIWVGLALGLAVWRAQPGNPWQARLTWSSLIGNGLLLGLILACYGVLLPVSVSTEGYWNNTAHLIYATAANVTHPGFALNLQSDWASRFAVVLAFNREFSALATVNLLYIVGAAAAVSAWRLATCHPRPITYWLVLAFFAAGLLMDFFSTLRFSWAYGPYAIYSVGFYGVGLAGWAGAELARVQLPQAWWQALAAWTLVAAAGLQVGLGSYAIMTSSPPVLSGSGYTPQEAWDMIKVYEPQFLRFMDYARLYPDCTVDVIPQASAECGYPGGIRGWLAAIGESQRQVQPANTRPDSLHCDPTLRPAVNLADGGCRSNQAIGAWWLLGYTVEAQGADTQVQLHWLPPPGITPQAMDGFMPGPGAEWVQTFSAAPMSDGFRWQNQEAVGLGGLAQAAPPLQVQGSRGNYVFRPVSTEGEMALRVTAGVTTALGADQPIIQFGPQSVSPESGLEVHPGQVVLMSLWARLSTAEARAKLLVGDQGALNEQTATTIDGTTWQHYTVLRATQPGARSLVLGLSWEPEAEAAWLEVKEWRIFVFDRREATATASGPLQPVTPVTYHPLELGAGLGEWTLLGYQMPAAVPNSGNAALELYWGKSAGNETAGADLRSLVKERWVQAVEAVPPLYTWTARADTVGVEGLAQAAPPLQVQGSRGEFAFNQLTLDGAPVLHVASVPTRTRPLTQPVLQIGPPSLNPEFGLDVQPGQVVLMSAEVRTSARSGQAALLVQDQTPEGWQSSQAVLGGADWQRLVVVREIRPAAQRISWGLSWEPPNGAAWLEVKNWRVFVFERIAGTAGAPLQLVPPIVYRPLEWEAQPKGWTLLGYQLLAPPAGRPDRPIVELYWRAPAGASAPKGLRSLSGGRWAQTIDAIPPLFVWQSGAQTVGLKGLAQAAPPLIVQGNRGEFTFGAVTVEGRPVLHIANPMTATAALSQAIIQFGPRLASLEAHPGQIVLTLLRVRASKPDGVTLFIQDQTADWQMSQARLSGPGWQWLVVVRQIRAAAQDMALGVVWEPPAGPAWLEIETWGVVAFDQARPTDPNAGSP